MKLVKKDLNEIKAAEYNPRKKLKPGDIEFENIKKSIENFGYVEPIVLNDDDTIISGHQRRNVMLYLGYKEADCIVVSVGKAEEKALNIALNKITGEWDVDKLKTLIVDIENLDLDITLTGFSMEEINAAVGDIDLSDEIEAVEDDFDIDKIQDSGKCEKGQIWKLGRHRLMCDDATNEKKVEKLIKNKTVDLVITDPPYGINIVGDNGKIGAPGLAKNGVYSKVIADDTTETARKACDILLKLCNKCVIWGGNYFVNFLPFSDGWLVWDKRMDMRSNNFADGEMAWCSFHTPLRIYHQIWNGMIREGENEKRVHPTQKPLRMLGEIISDFSKEGNMILDTFGGSGSILIACEQLNRDCFVMELDPHYCNVIIKRWEDYTGEKAVLLDE